MLHLLSLVQVHCCYIIILDLLYLYIAPTSLYQLQRANSGDNHTISFILQSRNSPPTNITCLRNNKILNIDGNTEEITPSCTNRPSTYFTITLNICDSPDNIVGNYMCQVANNFGINSAEIQVQGETYVPSYIVFEFLTILKSRYL